MTNKSIELVIEHSLKRINKLLNMFIIKNLIFYRENGDDGKVFCVIFYNEDKEIFALSDIRIGQPSLIIKACLEGEWNGTLIIRSTQPFLSADFICVPFLPNPFPDNVSKTHSIT